MRQTEAAHSEVKYAVKLSFEAIQLPPITDILVLGINAPHGKWGLSKCLELLAPGEFELIDVNEVNISAVFVSNKILLKMAKENVLKILIREVFPYVNQEEVLKVDFKINFIINNTEPES